MADFGLYLIMSNVNNLIQMTKLVNSFNTGKLMPCITVGNIDEMVIAQACFQRRPVTPLFRHIINTDNYSIIMLRLTQHFITRGR